MRLVNDCISEASIYIAISRGWGLKQIICVWTALPVVNKYEKAQPVRNHPLLSLTSQHLSKVQQYTMVLDNCSICMNYWTSHGNNMAGYQYLINDQHIPEAHASRPNRAPSGPLVSDLQSQLAAANARANDLQKQLDDCREAKKTLEDEVAKLKADKVNLENVNKLLVDEMKKKDVEFQQLDRIPT